MVSAAPDETRADVASSVSAQVLSIDHAAVGCVVAEKFPRMEARFSPDETLARARILFQAEGARHWYAVAMKPEGASFFGVLPRPKKSLKEYRYYIEATGKGMDTSRTAEYTTRVVDGPAACQGKLLAGTLGSASVALEIPAGAPAVPAGFSSSGVSVATAAGTTTGASAGGGGLPTSVLVGAGAAAAGAAAAVVARKGEPFKPIQIEGTVFRGACTCFARADDPRFARGTPIAGAIASTSLDDTTAVTDASGHFLLVTKTDRRPTKTYTFTLRAAGCETLSITGQADQATGPDAQVFSLICR